MTESTISKFRWASRALSGLAGLAALIVVADVGPDVHRYAALAVAALGYAATWCAKQLPPPEKSSGPKVPPAAVLAVGLLALTPACSPSLYEQGLLYTPYLAAARDLGAGELLGRARLKHTKCLAKHGANRAAYEACAHTEYRFVAGWLAAGWALCRTDGPLQGLLTEMRAAGAGK